MFKRISLHNFKRLSLFLVFLIIVVCTACSTSSTQEPASSLLDSSPATSPIQPTDTAPSLPSETPQESTPTQTPLPPPAITPTPAGAFKLVIFDPGISPAEIRDLWVAPHGQLSVATDAGILVNVNDEWELLYEGPVERLLGADPDGRIWAILEGETAIAAYDMSGSWTVYGPEQGWTVPPPEEYLTPGYGDGIVSGPSGGVWLATGRDDLRRFDPTSGTWQTFTADDVGFEPPEDEDYQGHFLTDVELSGNQKVWVGNCIGVGEGLKGQGIRWSDGESWFDAPYTAGECVLDIERDADNRMWVAGFDALMMYDPATAEWSSFPLPPWDRRQLVTEIALDQRGNPWVEVLRFGGASLLGDAARYHLQDGDWVTDFEGEFSSLAFDEQGTAWLCSAGTVYRLDSGEREDISGLSGVSCQIVVDGDGRLWIANNLVLFSYDPGQ